MQLRNLVSFFKTTTGQLAVQNSCIQIDTKVSKAGVELLKLFGANQNIGGAKDDNN